MFGGDSIDSTHVDKDVSKSALILLQVERFEAVTAPAWDSSSTIGKVEMCSIKEVAME